MNSNKRFDWHVDVSNPLVLQSLSGVCASLRADQTTSQSKRNTPLVISERMIGKVLFDLQYFMEERFGRFSTEPKPHPITKFPAAVYKDFTPRGAIFHIMTTILNIASEHNLESFENIFQTQTFSFLLALCKKIEVILRENGFIKRPKFYFNSIPEEHANIKQSFVTIIQNHGGEITTDPAIATHVLDWNSEVDKNLLDDNGALRACEGEQEDYVRILEVRSALSASLLRYIKHTGNETTTEENADINRHDDDIMTADKRMALVHWWYYPDSHDEWINAQEFFDTMADEAAVPDVAVEYTSRPTRRWNSLAWKFVWDCEMFNEWGNEMDYENEDAEVNVDFLAAGSSNNLGDAPKNNENAKTSRKTRGNKRKSNSGSAVSALSSSSSSLTPVLKLFKEAAVPQSVSSVTEKTLAADLVPAATLLQAFANAPNGTTGCVFKGKSESLIMMDISSQNSPPSIIDSGMTVANSEQKEAASSSKNEVTKKRSFNSIADNEVEKIEEDGANGASKKVKRDEELESSNNKSDHRILSDSITENERLRLGRLVGVGLIGKSAVEQEKEYIRCRNAIIELYFGGNADENEKTVKSSSTSSELPYLSATVCRRKIAADASFLHKIHEFLDSFGIINHLSVSPAASSGWLDDTFERCAPSLTSKLLADVLANNHTNDVPDLTNMYTKDIIQLLNNVNEFSDEWLKIILAGGNGSATKHLDQLHISQYLQQFVQLPLLNHPQQSTHGDEKHSSLATTILNDKNSNVNNKQDIVSSLQQTMEQVNTLEKTVSKLFATKEKESSSNSESTSLNVISNVVKEKYNSNVLKDSARRNTKLLEEYLVIRSTILEDKMKLVDRADRLLSLEQERLRTESHDQSLQKAFFASGCSNAPFASQPAAVEGEISSSSFTFTLPTSGSVASLQG